MQPRPRRHFRRGFDLYVWCRRYIPGEDLKTALETLKKGVKGDASAVQKIRACRRAICEQVLIVSWCLQLAFMPAWLCLLFCDQTLLQGSCVLPCA